jgi:zinc transport system ATP-binding protein
LVLENFNFEIFENDFVGVIGPNGGGKTTLLRLILGFLKPLSGKIEIFNNAPEKVRLQIGYVPQHSEMDKNFPITVREIVALGALPAHSYFPWFKQMALDRANQAMKFVKIENLARKAFSELSGGQRQRCLIARALAAQPEILLLDEPTASVDMSVEEDVFELLKILNEKMTIILVSHDLGFISSYVKRVACVNRHLVCHPIEMLSQEMVLEEAYQGNIAMIRHQCKL